MDTRQLLSETASKIFEDHCDKTLLDRSEGGNFATALWEVVKESGFHELAMTESGVDLADAYAFLKVAGSYAVPLPLGEILLANRWLADSSRMASIGILRGDGDVELAPWGESCEVVLGIRPEGGEIAVLEPPFSVEASRDLAGQRLDRIRAVEAAPLRLDENATSLLRIARIAFAAGCLERVLALTVEYAKEREQFGRPLARFQALQHDLAVMAGEVAAASRAADAAVDSIGTSRESAEVAIAKSRVGEAAGVAAEIAHQLHGAMGFTHEHALHHFTRRLWAFRDLDGSESFWNQRLGELVCGIEADDVWSFIATRG